MTDEITANPDLKAFWFGFDTAGQAGGQAVLAKFPGKTFPDKPWSSRSTPTSAPPT